MERNASGPMRGFAGAVVAFAVLAAVLSISLWSVAPGAALLIVQLIAGLTPLPLGVLGFRELAHRPERGANLATAAMLVEVLWLFYFLFLLVVPKAWGGGDLYS